MNLARLCARLKPVFLSKKGPSKARLLTKMSPSEELGTLLPPEENSQWKATQYISIIYNVIAIGSLPSTIEVIKYELH